MAVTAVDRHGLLGSTHQESAARRFACCRSGLIVWASQSKPTPATLSPPAAGQGFKPALMPVVAAATLTAQPPPTGQIAPRQTWPTGQIAPRQTWPARVRIPHNWWTVWPPGPQPALSCPAVSQVAFHWGPTAPTWPGVTQ